MKKGYYQASGDNFEVREVEPGTFEVRHFPDYITRRSCCKVKVTLTAADRAKAIPDADPHGVAACLARASAQIEAKHARTA